MTDHRKRNGWEKGKWMTTDILVERYKTMDRWQHSRINTSSRKQNWLKGSREDTAVLTKIERERSSYSCHNLSFHS